jgi:hypothetical protein
MKCKNKSLLAGACRVDNMGWENTCNNEMRTRTHNSGKGNVRNGARNEVSAQ